MPTDNTGTVITTLIAVGDSVVMRVANGNAVRITKLSVG